MIISNNKFKELLVPPGHLTEEEFASAVEFSKREEIGLYDALLNLDLISDENLGQLMAQALDVPFVNLKETAIPEETLKIIPEIVAKSQKIIAFERSKEGLKVAMLDPQNLEIKEFIEKKVGDEVLPYFATERDLNDALALYQPGLEEEFSEIIAKNARAAKGARGELVEPPIIEIVNTILSYAYQNKASDIHLEPREERTVVRFRIDGVLHDVVDIPLEIHPQIVTRIKVMAKLRTDEHMAAQDGKIQYEVSN